MMNVRLETSRRVTDCFSEWCFPFCADPATTDQASASRRGASTFPLSLVKCLGVGSFPSATCVFGFCIFITTCFVTLSSLPGGTVGYVNGRPVLQDPQEYLDYGRTVADDPDGFGKPDLLSQVFERYPSWHKANTGRDDAKFIVWSPCLRLPSGLGDNIRGAMGAYIIATVLRRVLIIDGGTTSFMQQVEPTMFDWTYPSTWNLSWSRVTLDMSYATKEGIDMDAIRAKIRGRKVVSLSLCELDRAFDVYSWLLDPNNSTATAKTLNDLSRAYEIARVVEASDVEAVQPVGGMFWDKGRFFRVLFGVKQDVEQAADFLADRIGLGLPGTYAGLHLRLGHGVRENWDRRFKRWNDFQNLSACLAASTIIAYENIQNARNGVSRPLSKPPQFFLATDTREVSPFLKEDMESLWPGTELVTTDFTPMHTGRNSTLSAARDVWIDMVLLSRSRYLFVGIPSGFANLAGWMSGRTKYFLGPCSDNPFVEQTRRETREIPLKVNIR